MNCIGGVTRISTYNIIHACTPMTCDGINILVVMNYSVRAPNNHDYGNGNIPGT